MMKPKDHEILEEILGDGAAETHARVRMAAQSHLDIAAKRSELESIAGACSAESDRLRGAYERAISAAVYELNHEPSFTVTRPSMFNLRALQWATTAAAACMFMVAGSMLIGDFGSASPGPDNHAFDVVPDAPDAGLRFSGSTQAGQESDRPFESLADAVSAVETGGTLTILSGATSETGRIEKAVRLVALDGTVRIGSGD